MVRTSGEPVHAVRERCWDCMDAGGNRLFAMGRRRCATCDEQQGMA